MGTYAQAQVNLGLPNPEVRIVPPNLPFPDGLQKLQSIASQGNGFRRHHPCFTVKSLWKNDDINPLRPPLTGLFLHRCTTNSPGRISSS
jgi:hypothetical protein